MKKFVCVLVAVMLFGNITSPAYAGDPIRKLGRGIANIGTSPIEFFAGMGKAKDERGVLAGLTWGILLGMYRLARRALVGVYETATFIIPIPADYEPVIDDPEFMLQEETVY